MAARRGASICARVMSGRRCDVCAQVRDSDRSRTGAKSGLEVVVRRGQDWERWRRKEEKHERSNPAQRLWTANERHALLLASRPEKMKIYTVKRIRMPNRLATSDFCSLLHCTLHPPSDIKVLRISKKALEIDFCHYGTTHSIGHLTSRQNFHSKWWASFTNPT
jgi:hypothetical protein